jgi:hypothetical protein
MTKQMLNISEEKKLLFLYENRKMRPVKTVPGTGRGAVKENDGGR